MLEVKNLNLNYKIDENVYKPILKNINVTFPNEGLIFIIGKSGSGKSSLLSVLEGINKPNQGKIMLDNKNLYEKINLNEYYSNIGILYQDFNLFNNLKVIDNLKLINNDINLIEKYLKNYNLENVRNNYVYKLSGGEKQRVALIRALIKNPDIIFADEPTGALDDVSSNFLFEELFNLSKNKLVIVVTHNEDYIKKYNSKYIKLENGSIVFNNVDNKVENKSTFNNKNIFLNKKILFKKINKENKKISYLSIISLLISFLILLLSGNFIYSFNNYSNNIINRYYSNNVFTCSKINKIKSNNSLSITKKQIPDEDILDLLNENKIDFTIKYNLNYFISNNESFINNNSYDNLNYKPYYDDKNINNGIVINSLMAEKYDLKVNSIIDVKIKRYFNFYFEEIKDYFKEEINLEITFKINEIINEFNFSNSPKIYYNYSFLYNLLSNTISPNLSLLKEKEVNLIDLYNFSNKNEELNSYSKIIISNNIKEITSKNFQDILKNNNYEISNDAYVLSSSFISLISTLEIGIDLFVFIVFFGSILILLFINISLINSSKKDVAIFLSLGFKKRNIINSYFYKDLLLISFSFILTCFLNHFIYEILNKKISNRLKLDFILTNNLYFSLIIYLMFILIIYFVYSIAFKKIQNVSIYKELKEE